MRSRLPLVQPQLGVNGSRKAVALSPVLPYSTRKLRTEHVLHSHGTLRRSSSVPNAAEDLPRLLYV